MDNQTPNQSPPTANPIPNPAVKRPPSSISKSLLSGKTTFMTLFILTILALVFVIPFPRYIGRTACAPCQDKNNCPPCPSQQWVFEKPIFWSIILPMLKGSPTNSTAQVNTSQLISSPTPTSDPTANWKTYNGKYFSFKYPSNWTDSTGPSKSYPGNLEVIGLRIGVAVFEASYQDLSYEKALGRLKERKHEDYKLAGREATKFEYIGQGDVLPPDYSIISVVVKGNNNRSYNIVFNGPHKDITDELIDTVLSTFRFASP